MVTSREIQEIVRIIDSKQNEKSYAVKKSGYKYDFVDIEARNAFQSNKVSLSMIKCAHGFNYFGLRDSMINGTIIELYCPRCDNVET